MTVKFVLKETEFKIDFTDGELMVTFISNCCVNNLVDKFEIYDGDFKAGEVVVFRKDKK